MEHASQLLTYISVVSMAAERFVQIVRALPISAKLNKSIYYQVLAAVFGAILCLIEPPELSFISLNKYLLAALVGLAVSGGSGVWHDALEVVKNYGKKT